MFEWIKNLFVSIVTLVTVTFSPTSSLPQEQVATTSATIEIQEVASPSATPKVLGTVKSQTTVRVINPTPTPLQTTQTTESALVTEPQTTTIETNTQATAEPQATPTPTPATTQAQSEVASTPTPTQTPTEAFSYSQNTSGSYRNGTDYKLQINVHANKPLSECKITIYESGTKEGTGSISGNNCTYNYKYAYTQPSYSFIIKASSGESINAGPF